MRIRGTKTELEEAGEETDGMVENTSKLRKQVMALTNIDGNGGVDILTDSGAFRSTYDILLDIAQIWDQLNDYDPKAQAALLELLAGKTRGSQLAAILQNPEDLKAAYETAMNSAGSAMQENEKYLDSIQGRIDILTNSIQTMWMNALNSDAVKFIINVLNGLIKIVDEINLIKVAFGGLFAVMALRKDSYLGSFFKFDESFGVGELGKDIKGIGSKLFSKIFSKENAAEATDELADVITETVQGATENIDIDTSWLDWLELSSEATDELTDAQTRQAASARAATTANKTTAQSQKAMGLSAKAAAVGVKLLNAALAFGLGLLVSFAIEKVIGAIDDLIHKQEKLNESAQEVLSTYSKAKDELTSMKSTIDSVGKDFERLSKGVDQFGNNISLSTDEYKRYNEIVNQIADNFPGMIGGYTQEGNAILICKGNVEALTEAYKENAREARNSIILGGDEVFAAAKGNIKDYEKQAKAYEAAMAMANGTSTERALEIYGEDIRSAAVKILEDLDFESYIGTYASGKQYKSYGLKKKWNGQEYVDDYTYEEYLAHNEKLNKLMLGRNGILSKQKQELTKINTVLQAYLENDVTYVEMSDEARKAINSIVSSLNPADFDFDDDAMEAFIKSNIIIPIYNNQNGVQDAINDIFNLDPSKMDWETYKATFAKITDALWNAFGGANNTIKNGEPISKDAFFKMFGLDMRDTKPYEKKIQEKLIQIWNMSEEQAQNYLNSLSPVTMNRLFEVNWDNVTDPKELERIINNSVFDFELDITAEKESLNALNTALSESASATGMTAEAINGLKSRYSELVNEGYNLDALFEETTNGIHLNAKALGELEQAYAKQNLDGINKKLFNLTEEYDSLTEQIQNCGNAYKRADLYSERDKIQTEIKDLATLASQYEGLTSAYQQWQNAKSAGNERDMYEGILEGKKELEDEMSRGWLDESTRKYLELLSGENLSTVSWDKVLEVFNQVNSTIKGTNYDVFDFFTQDDDGNSTTKGIYNFFDAIIQKQKELNKEWVKVNEDGSYSFNFSIDGDQAIAEALGVSEELVQIILRAAKDAGFDINLESAYSDLAELQTAAEAANDTLKRLAKTEYTFNVNSTNISNIEEQIKEAQNIFDTFKNSDGTLNIEAEGFQEIQIILATLIRQKQELEIPAILSIDTNSANTEIQTIMGLINEFKTNYNTLELQTSIGEDTTAAQNNLNSTIAKLQESNPEVLAKIGIDPNASAQDINTAINNINQEELGKILIEAGIDETLVNEFINGDHDTTATCLWENDTTLVDSFMAENHDISAKVIWKSDTTQLSPPNLSWPFFVNGTAHARGTLPPKGSAFAGGSWGAPKTETALVGELGPELLVRDGRWTTIGDNGAEFTDVRKNDIIFNHKQTEEILKNGHISSRGKAYASGNFNLINSIGSPIKNLKNEIKPLIQEILKQIIDSLSDEYNSLVNGNVDYNKRPIVAPEVMRKSGWDDFDGDVATTYDIDYTVGDASGKEYMVKVTPILENGEVLSPEELDDYINNVLSGTNNILAADKDNLVINIEPYISDDQFSSLDEQLGDIKNEHWILTQKYADSINASPYTVTIDSMVNPETASETDEQLNNLAKDRTSTIYVNTVNSTDNNVGGGPYNTNRWNIRGSRADGSAHSSGSWGLPQAEHNALVGELGQELIVDPKSGTWHTVGDHGAEFTNVPRGSIIFNHKQTEDLLSKGYITGRGKAYASGTAYYSGSNGGGPGASKVPNAVIKISSSSSKSSSNSNKDETEDLIDFIEIKLEEIESNISKTEAKLERFLDDTSQIEEKRAAYSSLIADEQLKATTYSKAAVEYNKKATELLQEVPAQYREMAQNGAIAIKDFVGESDTETANAINNYREWAKKADDAQINELESLNRISELSLNELKDIADDYGNNIGLIEGRDNLIQAEIDLADAKGLRTSAVFLQEQLNNNNAKLAELTQERVDLINSLNGKITVGTDDWYEAVGVINDVDTEIINCKVDAEKLNDSINDIRWDNLDKFISRLESLDSELSNLYDTLSDNDDVVDEFGNWNEKGIASLGVLTQRMDIAQATAQEYGNQINDLNANWRAWGLSEDEYYEKLDELTEKQWDSINAYRSTKKEIVSLNKVRVDAIKKGLQKELDAYKKLISKKKEALSADKDLYEFEKSVKEKQKNIADIERKLAALSGDTSASAMAQRRQLEADLAEANADLEDTYYDRSVENQQTALDKESEQYEDNINTKMENLDKYLEDEEQVISDSMNTVKQNTGIVLGEINKISETYGVQISNSITQPWKDGAGAINGYNSSFINFSNSFCSEIEKIKARQQELQSIAENAARDAITSVDNSMATATSGNVTIDNKGVTVNHPVTSNQPASSTPVTQQSTQTSSTAGSVSNIKQVLNRGDKGSDVKSLQTALSNMGYYKGKIDGSFGPQTEAAVKQYQKDQGNLAVDGYVGPLTKKKLAKDGYAKGIKSVPENDFAWIDEIGEELVLHAGENGKLAYLTKGSSVIPADLTNKLMDLVIDPTQTLEQSKPIINAPQITNNEINMTMKIDKVVNIEHVDNETLPDLTKTIEKQMDNYVKRLNSQLRKFAR